MKTRPVSFAAVLALAFLATPAAAHAFDVAGSAFLGIQEFPCKLFASRDPNDPELFIFNFLVGDIFDPLLSVFFQGTSNYQGEHEDNENVTIPMFAKSTTPGHDFLVGGFQEGSDVVLAGHYNDYQLVLGL